MKPFGDQWPTSTGSERLGSPRGEDLKTFFFRYMARKELKTGWRSGKAEQRDTRHVRGEILDRPFIALLDALVEAGFAPTWGEAKILLRRLGDTEPRIGILEKNGSIRYWIRRTEKPDDF